MTGAAEGAEVIPFERSALDGILGIGADPADMAPSFATGDWIDAPWGDGEAEPFFFDDGAYPGDLEVESFPTDNDPSDEAFERQYGISRAQFFAELERHRPSAPTVQKGHYFKKPIPAQLRWAVFRRDGYRCVKCGCDEDLTADHIHAEVHGGKATISNLQTLCRPCNSRKGSR